MMRFFMGNPLFKISENKTIKKWQKSLDTYENETENNINHNIDKEISGVQYFITDANDDQLLEINNNIDALINRVNDKEDKL